MKTITYYLIKIIGHLICLFALCIIFINAI